MGRAGRLLGRQVDERVQSPGTCPLREDEAARRDRSVMWAGVANPRCPNSVCTEDVWP